MDTKIVRRLQVFLPALLFLIVAAVLTTAQAASKKDQKLPQAAEKVHVKLPDGLYLFQVYVADDVVSPLALIKGGKLIDPYVLAHKMGIPKFLQTYVEGRTFNVYVGPEKIGEATNLSLAPKTPCYINELPSIEGKSSYTGKPLAKVYSQNTISERGKPVYQPVKAIVTPPGFQTSKAVPSFIVTDADKFAMVKALYKDVLPAIVQLGKDYGVGGKEVGSLHLAQALDLDGNGEKDFVGVYFLSFPTGSRSVVFVLRDTGKAEKVALSHDSGSPAFALGGVLDLDLDGVQELVVQTLGRSFPDVDAGSDEVRQIEIWRRGVPGWVRIYRTVQIGCFWRIDY